MIEEDATLEVNGWTIFDDFCKKNDTRWLAGIVTLAFGEIPQDQDPEREEYRQGTTLGVDRKH